MSWISANLAPLMFGGMVLFMLIGYPAAFSLAATGLFFGFLGIESVSYTHLTLPTICSV